MRLRSWIPMLVVVALLTAALGGRAADEFKLEDGFTLLFNGKDLTGWKTKKDSVSLEGKADAYDKRFLVKDGIIVVDPKVKGDVIIETAKEYGNDVHLKFEYMPGEGCNNDLFFRGLKFDLKKGDVKNIKQDEWNTFEIIVKGEDVEFKNNGETMKKDKAKAKSSVLGVRAELGPIQIRRVRIMEAK